jgi:hypothetical protein
MVHKVRCSQLHGEVLGPLGEEVSRDIKNWEGLRPLSNVRRKIMAIGTAVQSGKTIAVYDERGRRLTNLSVGSGPKDGLQGFTSATVSVRFGTMINIYDERGRRLSTVAAGR